MFGIPLQGSLLPLLKKIRKRWGVLFQEGALYSALSVYDNIALPMRELRCFDEGFVHDMVMLKLDMVGIERRHAAKMPSDLSGGMVKRIALARAGAGTGAGVPRRAHRGARPGPQRVVRVAHPVAR